MDNKFLGRLPQQIDSTVQVDVPEIPCATRSVLGKVLQSLAGKAPH